MKKLLFVILTLSLMIGLLSAQESPMIGRESYSVRANLGTHQGNVGVDNHNAPVEGIWFGTEQMGERNTMFSHLNNHTTIDDAWGGTAVPWEVGAFHRWTPAQLASAGVAGQRLDKIGIVIRSGAENPLNVFELRVYTGGSAGSPPSFAPLNPGTLIHSQIVTGLQSSSGTAPIPAVWNDMTLNAEVMIPTDEELWFGYFVTQNAPDTHPTGLGDTNNTLDGHSYIVYTQGAWQNRLQNYNESWMIRGYAVSPSDPDYPSVRNLKAEPDVVNQTVKLTWDEPNADIPDPVQFTHALTQFIQVGNDNVPIGSGWRPMNRYSPTHLEGFGVVGWNLKAFGFRASQHGHLANYELLFWHGQPFASYNHMQPNYAHDLDAGDVTQDSWYTHELPNPVPITAGHDLVFGFGVYNAIGPTTGRFNGFVMDEGPAVEGFGNLSHTNAGWSTITLPRNTHIFGVAEHPDSREIRIFGLDQDMEITWIEDFMNRPFTEIEYTVSPIADSIPYYPPTISISRGGRNWTGFEISRNTANPQVLDTIGPTVMEYTDTNVPYFTDHIYTVRAVYGSEFSNPVSITVYLEGPNPPVDPPLNLTSTAGLNKITLNWQAPTGIRTPSGYKIYRDGEEVGNTAADVLTFEDDRLVNGVDYNHYVTAMYTRPIGESAPSNIVNTTPTGTTIYPFMPYNLRPLTQYDANVSLQWDPPIFFIPWPPAPGISMSHADSDDSSNGIGTNSALSESMAHRFTPEQIAELGVGGKHITWAAVYGTFGPAEPAVFTFRVWTGGTWTGDPNTNNSGTLIYEQLIGPQPGTEWKVFELDTPVAIPSDREVWIGFLVTTPGGYPFMRDTGDNTKRAYGNLLSWNGRWDELWNLGADDQPPLVGNFMIRALAGDPGNMKLLGSGIDNPIVINESSISQETFSFSEGTLTSSEATQSLSSPRNFLNYRVYRGEEPLTTTRETFYIAEDQPTGNQTYSVSAVYEGGLESDKLNGYINVNGRVIIKHEDLPYFQGFNSGSAPTGWNILHQAPSNRNWVFIGAPQAVPYEGTHTAASISRLPDGQNLTPDNWLFTPRIEIPSSATSFYLTYWVGATHPERFAENYSVLVSNTSPYIDQFSQVLFTETLTTDEWQFREIDLKAFAGQTVIVAFRHHEVSGQNSLKIDAVHIDYELSIGENPELPIRTELLGNYPNPFNPETTIDFNVKAESHVSIDIFNIRGQKVRTLVDDFYGAGNHKAIWNGNDDTGRAVSSGIYFYRMNADGVSSTKRMVLMK